MSKFTIGFLAFVLLTIATGFLFKDRLLKFYHATGNVLTSVPLNVGGKENNASFTAAEVIIETNLQRKQNGNLPALKESAKLTAAAKAKADDMFASQYFEHVSPSGMDPGELVKARGYAYVLAGENLILGNFASEKEVVQLWMDSPGHRANILNNRFVDIGVAMVKGTYKGQVAWIGVQEFGLPLANCPPQASDVLKNQIEDNKTKLDTLAVQIEAKRQEIENTNSRSEKYNQLVDEYNALVGQYNVLNDQTKEIINQYNAQINAFKTCVAGK